MHANLSYGALHLQLSQTVYLSDLSCTVTFVHCVQMRFSILNKIAPHGTDGRLLLSANFKVTWHKN